MAHNAGAGRLSLNERGATPNALSMYNATKFPFSDAGQRDPNSGRTEGLLDNDRARQNQPKIFYTNTGVEYWGGGRAAALVHTTPDGKSDLTPPDNVRVYLLAGTQHSPARFPPRMTADSSSTTRSSMRGRCGRCSRRWIAGSARARRRRRASIRGSPTDRSSLAITPRSRRFRVSPRPARSRRAAMARSCGRCWCRRWTRTATSAPESRPGGRGTAGNLHGLEFPQSGDRRTGRTREPAGIGDSVCPDADAREAAGDPRRSIEERYPSSEAYLARIREAGQKLVEGRYLLAEDLPKVVERAREHWDLPTMTTSSR